jgi:hypothetical protein
MDILTILAKCSVQPKEILNGRVSEIGKVFGSSKKSCESSMKGKNVMKCHATSTSKC